DHPEKVAPHLHISMQSGSDSVLRRMRRRWGSRRFVDRCHLLRERLDKPAITTDVIVGFPGETDAEFQETIDVCREAGFSKIHIFPFSARRGTPAATMPAQLSKQEKKARVHELQEVETELRDEYFRSLVGRRLRVLVESPAPGEPGAMIGASCRYAPVVVREGELGAFKEVVATRVERGVIHEASA
ncbi:MAG: radical SAM protein, partial [Planctomycetales bacterium]|nr:radical SAM protein [Planctomycetales bacterium]